MVKIICDNCGAQRPEKLEPGVEWILGYDLQLVGPNALQRSIRFLERWDDRRALEIGAVHLCSLQCKDEYMAQGVVEGKKASGR
jgi:hypothetical protein